MSSCLDAAQKAAAEVKAKLIAAGQLSNGKTIGNHPTSDSSGTSKSLRVAGAAGCAKSRLGMFHTEEVVINDVSMSARNYLTRTATQEEITKISGASVSTRGRYLSAAEVAKLPPDPPSNERPLFLHIQGANEQDVKVAVGRVMHIILEHNQGNKSTTNNGKSSSKFHGRGRNHSKFGTGSRFSPAKPGWASNLEGNANAIADKMQCRKSVYERLGTPHPPSITPDVDPMLAGASNGNDLALVSQENFDLRLRLRPPCYEPNPPVVGSALVEPENSKVTFLVAPPPAPLQREKVFLPDLAGVPATEVFAALAGENEENLQYIREETGVNVVLRGTGSLDTLTSTLQPEALHFYLEHTDINRFNNAKSLVVNLAQTVISELQQQVLQKQVHLQVHEQHLQLHQLAQQQIQQLRQQQLQEAQQQVEQQQHVQQQQQIHQAEQQLQLVQQQHLIQHQPQHTAIEQQQVSHVVVTPTVDAQHQTSHVVLHQVQFQLPQAEHPHQQYSQPAQEVAYQFTIANQPAASSVPDVHTHVEVKAEITANAASVENLIPQTLAPGNLPTSSNSSSLNFSAPGIPVTSAASNVHQILRTTPSRFSEHLDTAGSSSKHHFAHQETVRATHAMAKDESVNTTEPQIHSATSQELPVGASSSIEHQSHGSGLETTQTATTEHESATANELPSSEAQRMACSSSLAHTVSSFAPSMVSQPSVAIPYYVSVPSYPPPTPSVATYDASQPPPVSHPPATVAQAAVVPSASYATISVASYAAAPAASYAATPAASYAATPAASYATASYASPATSHSSAPVVSYASVPSTSNAAVEPATQTEAPAANFGTPSVSAYNPHTRSYDVSVPLVSSAEVSQYPPSTANTVVNSQFGQQCHLQGQQESALHLQNEHQVTILSQPHQVPSQLQSQHHLAVSQAQSLQQTGEPRAEMQPPNLSHSQVYPPTSAQQQPVSPYKAQTHHLSARQSPSSLNQSPYYVNHKPPSTSAAEETRISSAPDYLLREQRTDPNRNHLDVEQRHSGEQQENRPAHIHEHEHLHFQYPQPPNTNDGHHHQIQQQQEMQQQQQIQQQQIHHQQQQLQQPQHNVIYQTHSRPEQGTHQDSYHLQQQAVDQHQSYLRRKDEQEQMLQASQDLQMKLQTPNEFVDNSHKNIYQAHQPTSATQLGQEMYDPHNYPESRQQNYETTPYQEYQGSTGSAHNSLHWQQQQRNEFHSTDVAGPPKSSVGPGGVVARAPPQRLVYDSGYCSNSAAHATSTAAPLHLTVAELSQHPPPPPPPAPPTPTLRDYHQPIINPLPEFPVRQLPEYAARHGDSMQSNTGWSVYPNAAAGAPSHRGELQRQPTRDFCHAGGESNVSGRRSRIDGGKNTLEDRSLDQAGESGATDADKGILNTGRRSDTTAVVRRYGNYPFGSVGPIKRRRF
ncbi:DNA N6-methyl adenine demethylase [Hyalella azteca]|uniref:KH homology domain-containing protein 4 n=1 Tax=Hyalella azteca TaxID=294128 RepID=A0A8B7PM97_HYAAZ|nr:DNA N6-methyl adenine demethylase [Hyalella azteca]